MKFTQNKNFFFYISFLYLILAINSFPFIYRFDDLLSIVRITMGYSPYIILFISLIYLFLNRSKIKINFLNSFLLLFIFYSLFQLPSLIQSNKIIFSHGLYWILSSITLPLFLICLHIENTKLIYKLFNIMALLLFIITMLFLFLIFFEIFTKNYVNFSFYGNTALDPSLQFLYSGVPRSSGMSRLCILFFIIFHQIYLNYNFKNNFQRYLIYILTVFFLFCTLHMQSRIVIAFIIIYCFFNILPFANKKEFSKRLSHIIILTFISFFINLSFPILSAKIKFNYLHFNPEKVHPDLLPLLVETVDPNNIDQSIKKNENFIDKILKDKKLGSYVSKVSKGRMDKNINSSGRVTLWMNGLSLAGKKIIIGYGPMSDRVYISENVSNLYVYSLLAGGLISFLFLLVFNLIIIFRCFKDTFINSQLTKNISIYKKISLYLVGFLVVRSIAENSYSVFGIDHFIFLICSFIIISENEIKNKNFF